MNMHVKPSEGASYDENPKEITQSPENKSRELGAVLKDPERVRLYKQLKRKEYAPTAVELFCLLDGMDTAEIKKRVTLANRLGRYGVKIFTFDDFINDLEKIELTEDFKKKLNLLRQKKYAPTSIREVVFVNSMDIKEIKRRISIAKQFREYGIEAISFYDFEKILSTIELTEDLKNKLSLLKGKKYAPKYLSHVNKLNNMEINEIKSRIAFANQSGKSIDFFDFYRIKL